MYSREDLLDMGDVDENSENAHVPDKPSEIRPAFTSSQYRGGSSAVPDDDDDDDDGYDNSANWNIRKCAAVSP